MALALGYFDGIHKAHIQIINNLKKQAEILNTKCAIITFKNNPANCFAPEFIPDIQTLEQKQKILEKMEVDYLYVLDFEKYKDMTAKEYLNEILIKNFEPKLIISGYNHTFGKNKSGNSEFLKKNANANVIIEKQFNINNTKVSSTLIRSLIKNGKLEEVNSFLGRDFSVLNEVISGDKVARTLGYPTINLKMQDNIIKPPYGVYNGMVEFEDKKLPALISWGTKPTFKNTKEEVLEAHIYNFSGDLYGKKAEIFFNKRLRNQKTFESVQSLKCQLDKDYKNFKETINIS